MWWGVDGGQGREQVVLGPDQGLMPEDEKQDNDHLPNFCQNGLY